MHVIGTTCSGKSTLAARLAQALQVPVVELDAINWLPGWVSLAATEPEAFALQVTTATSANGWVVAGSYADFTRHICWPRVHTVVWLDLPLPVILFRVIMRSWRRWRSKELLWGTNREDFWRQLMLWRREDSLLWWALTTHKPRSRRLLTEMLEPRWSHIRFVRLTSTQEVESFVRLVQPAASVP